MYTIIRQLTIKVRSADFFSEQLTPFSILHLLKETLLETDKKYPNNFLTSFSSILNALSFIYKCLFVGHISFMIISLGIFEHKYPIQPINQW